MAAETSPPAVAAAATAAFAAAEEATAGLALRALWVGVAADVVREAGVGDDWYAVWAGSCVRAGTLDGDRQSGWKDRQRVAAGGQDVSQAHGHPGVGCLVPVDCAPEVVVGLHSLLHGGLPFVEHEVTCSNHLTVGGGAESAGDEGVQAAKVVENFIPGLRDADVGAVVHILTASAVEVAGEGGHNDDESAAADGDDAFQVGYCCR